MISTSPLSYPTTTRRKRHMNTSTAQPHPPSTRLLLPTLFLFTLLLLLLISPGVDASRGFGVLLNQHVLDYMNTVARLQNAASDPDLPNRISEIATELGFNRLSYYWETPFASTGTENFAQAVLGRKGSVCYAVMHGLPVEDDYRFVPNPVPLANLQRSWLNCIPDETNDNCQCRAHWLWVDRNFPEYWQELQSELDTCMSNCLARNDDCNMVLGGFGEGGMVAQLLSYQFANTAHNAPYVIATGSSNVLYDADCEGIDHSRYFRFVNTADTTTGDGSANYGLCFDSIPFLGQDSLADLGNTIGLGMERGNNGMVLGLGGTGQLMTFEPSARRSSLCRTAHDSESYQSKLQLAFLRNPSGLTPAGFGSNQYCEVDRDCQSGNVCAVGTVSYPECLLGQAPGTPAPTLATPPPTTPRPTPGPTLPPTTPVPTPNPTPGPTTLPPSTAFPTPNPTAAPTSAPPTPNPTTPAPVLTLSPIARPPSPMPTRRPTLPPSTPNPTARPTLPPTTPNPTARPTLPPTTPEPSPGPTLPPTTPNPTIRTTTAASVLPAVTPNPTTTKPTSSPSSSPSSSPPTSTPTTASPVASDSTVNTQEPSQTPTEDIITSAPTTMLDAEEVLIDIDTDAPTKANDDTETNTPSQRPILSSPTQQPTSNTTPSPSILVYSIENDFFRVTLVLKDVTEKLGGFTVFMWEDETSEHLRDWILQHTVDENWDPPLMQLRVQANIVTQQLLFTTAPLEQTAPPNVISASMAAPKEKNGDKKQKGRGGNSRRTRGRRGRRRIQEERVEALQIVFEVAISYRAPEDDNGELDLSSLILQAFQSGKGRSQYGKRLKDSDDPTFASLSDFVLQVESNSVLNRVEGQGGNTAGGVLDDPVLFWIIVGSASFAAVMSALILVVYWRRTGKGQYMEGSASSGTGFGPPNLLDKAIFEPAQGGDNRVSPSGARLSQEIVVDRSGQDDGISTLGDPTFYPGSPLMNNDETTADNTANLNYARSYLNNHKYDDNNRTFVSDQQSRSRKDTDHSMNRSVTSGSGLSFSKVGSGLSNLNESAIFTDDEGSFEEQFAGRDHCFVVAAPRGKLGIIIDLNDDGEPLVRAIRGDSVLARKVKVGDRLLSVDGEGCADMSAETVSKLIALKSNQPKREIMFVRRQFDYM
ncbi:Intercellular signal essential for a variety of patterning events during development (By similarity) [Seminavis robusta]|uniref:Intercellular signal essential for a variety of patterning events during development By similarity n=1 Tax=Seminavis robusta TaxID=568900 RepID=A0A9N8H8G8_9STRA|nr:Intercellular signal essential for a variety of patterning events during development (By similarity) [Seminavis robusta]|eukprot:Sro239_g096020.1 Intercellular signal essential for a variety of patterning events during development (By similarity) (1153) ;mRNA; r:77233-80880